MSAAGESGEKNLERVAGDKRGSNDAPVEVQGTAADAGGKRSGDPGGRRSGDPGGKRV